MRIHESAENYLETILMLTKKQPYVHGELIVVVQKTYEGQQVAATSVDVNELRNRLIECRNKNSENLIPTLENQTLKLDNLLIPNLPKLVDQFTFLQRLDLSGNRLNGNCLTCEV